jgi:hypothetical protein
MVSYKVLPLEGVPPQVHTITFLMNPGYTLNGSLDGQVGTAAADDRFYKDVPAMRVQFGSKYPASYLKLEEAIELQSRIDRMDKEREAYYLNFNSRQVDVSSLDQNVDTAGGPVRKVEEEGGADEIGKMSEEAEGEAGAKKAEGERTIDKYQAMATSNSRAAGLAAWQTKMEKLLIRAGKQNIVNSYVWDADGGLHISSESFANSITHSIGGSFSFTGSLGFEIEVTAGISVGLGVAAGVGVELTMSKSESTAREVALEVDLSGMEHRDITDYQDRPLFPGEKVDRYRFSSFLLEGSTGHFNDFFNQVVDPEWLASNDEEARALRMIDTDKPNKTWRVLHRVTYVERPALLGFGQDTRPRVRPEAGSGPNGQWEKMDRNMQDIERNTDRLQSQIDRLEEALAAAKNQNSDMAAQLAAIIDLLRKQV